MGESLQLILLLAALIGIYVFMFRGVFGKSRGPSLFARGSTRSSGAPAWGTALMGGFAAGQVAPVIDVPSVVITLAVVAGVSAALGKVWNWASWPAAGIGLGAMAVSVINFFTGNGVGAWGILFSVGLLVALADTARYALRWRRGASAADKAMAYFAATEAAMFLVEPGGESILTLIEGSAGVGSVVLVLLLLGVPLVLGLVDGPFLAMFSAGIGLAGIYFAFEGVGELSFVDNMALLAFAMVGYWVVRWVTRGFSGVGLLSD